MGYDTTGEILNSSIRQLLMEELDVEGEPIFQSVERTMKDNTYRVLFTEPNQELCQHILEDIGTWIANRFEHSDDPTAYRQDHHVKIFSTTTDKRKSQQQVKLEHTQKASSKSVAQVIQMKQRTTSTMPQLCMQQQ
jgi:hypothetical protein